MQNVSMGYVDIVRMTHFLHGIRIDSCEENFIPARVTLYFAVRVEWLVILWLFWGFAA